MSTAAKTNLQSRLRASGLHFVASLLVALLAGLLVFAVWYPYPYRQTSGGKDLFLILVAVDVILGPLMTLAVFNVRKPRQELIRDMTIVVLIQLAALGYGLWSVFVARPVHLVFEYDRFRVVHAVDVPAEMMDRAPEGVRTLPALGPTPLALRPFRDVQEEGAATIAALQGLPLAARPDLWQDYAAAHARLAYAAKPMSALREKHPDQQSKIDAAIAQTGQSEAELIWLPMVDLKSFWTVLLDAGTMDVKGFLPLDSF